MSEHHDTTTDTTDTEEPDEQLGEPGKRALEAERKARKDAERRAREAEARATALERADTLRRVAAEKGLSDEQAAYLAGDTEEELAASADAIVAAFTKNDAPRRPREKLRSGAVPSVDPDDRTSAVADRIISGGW